MLVLFGKKKKKLYQNQFNPSTNFCSVAMIDL